MSQFLKKVFPAIVVCMAVAFSAYAQTKEEISRFRNEVESDLTGNILPFWMDKAVDPAGGFYGTVVNDGTAVPQSPKSAVMNARVLWAFSMAYRRYGLDSYRGTADRAADYYIAHFIDKEYGGAVWSVTPEGEVRDGTKQSYASAFGIYGLAEHFRATGTDRTTTATSLSSLWTGWAVEVILFMRSLNAVFPLNRSYICEIRL